MFELQDVLFFVEGFEELGDLAEGLATDDVTDRVVLFLGDLLFEFLDGEELADRGDTVGDTGNNVLAQGDVEGLVVGVDSVLEHFLLQRVLEALLGDG